MTGKEMCEKMAAFLKERFPGQPTPTAEAIWKQSPTGELWPVFEMWEFCKSEGMAT